MPLFVWISNRLARLRSWSRIVDFYLRAEGKRLAMRRFGARHSEIVDHAVEFESMCEAMAGADWPVLREYVRRHPDFPNQSNALTGQPWFHTGVELGAPDVISWMIDIGADLNRFDDQGYSPLGYATLREEDAAEVVRLLIGAGAELRATDVIGNTALHVAASNGAMKAAEALLDAGADPRAYNSDTSPATPIHLAELAGHDRMVAMLRAAK